MTERQVSFFTAAAAHAGSLMTGVVFLVGGAAWCVTMVSIADDSILGRDWILDGRAERAQGVVTRTEIVRNIHSGRRHPHRIRYTFVDSDGRTRSGVCYTWEAPPAVGREVEVEYLPHRGDCSRVAGTSASVLPTWLMAVGAGMFLLGAGLLIWGFVRTTRRAELLRTGPLAEAKVLEARFGFSHLGRKRLLKVRYRFTAGAAGDMEAGDSVYALSVPQPGSGITVCYDERDPSVSAVFSLEPKPGA